MPHQGDRRRITAKSARDTTMSWQPDIDEFNRRAAMSRQMGGADSVAFHRSRGKLTVRERLDILADPGTFQK